MPPTAQSAPNYSNQQIKIRDHDHLTGEYRDPAHNA